MSLAAGYLLAELLSEAEDAPARLSPALRDRIEADRAAMTGLSRKQRAATLVAALRPPAADFARVRLPQKVWSRLCDPRLAHTQRVRRELTELGCVPGGEA